MAILSRLVNIGARQNKILVTPVRHGGGIGGRVENRPSRWNYDIFKDHLHFYLALGAIPLGLCIVVSNIFTGPAKLAPLPEGYVPQEHEYYKSPITRWMMKHIFPSYQQLYEGNLSRAWEAEKARCMNQLSREVDRQMKNHQDYKGWYTQDYESDYVRIAMNAQHQMIEGHGFHGKVAKE